MNVGKVAFRFTRSLFRPAVDSAASLATRAGTSQSQSMPKLIPGSTKLFNSLNTYGHSLKDLAKRHTAPAEAPAAPLVIAQLQAARDERRVASFVVQQHSTCDTIFIDVGAGNRALNMLQTIVTLDEALLQPTPASKAQKAKAAMSRARRRSRTRGRLLPPPLLLPPPPSLPPPQSPPPPPARLRGCRTCVITLHGGSDAAQNASTLRDALRARGVPLLVLRGAASAGSGLEPVPRLMQRRTSNGRRAIDLAQSVVHSAARHARPSQRLILRLDSGMEADSILTAHLVLSQALCRLHMLLLPNRTAGAEVMLGRSWDAAWDSPEHAAAAMAWSDWSARALAVAIKKQKRECQTRIVRVPDVPPAVPPAMPPAVPSAAPTAVTRLIGSSSPSSPPSPSFDALPGCPSTSSGRTRNGQAPHTGGDRRGGENIGGGAGRDLTHLSRLSREDEARLDALFASHKCTHAYLDVGSNIGVQLRKLYEPRKYRGASVLPIFDAHFGADRCRVCAIGVEVYDGRTRHRLRQPSNPNPLIAQRFRSVPPCAQLRLPNPNAHPC